LRDVEVMWLTGRLIPDHKTIEKLVKLESEMQRHRGVTRPTVQAQ
jgi:hypothetical protein